MIMRWTLLAAAAALALGPVQAQAAPPTTTLPRIAASRLKARAELSRALQQAHARVVQAGPTLDVEVVGAAPAEGGAVVLASVPGAPGPTVAVTGAPAPPATAAGGDASDGCASAGEACDEQEHVRPASAPAAAAGVQAQPEPGGDGERPCAGTGEACDEEEGLRATPISPAPGPTLTQAGAGAETYAMRFDVPAGGSLEVLIDREGRVRDVRVLRGAGARPAGR